MRPLLMFEADDFPVVTENQPDRADLVQDLELERLWQCAAAGDRAIYASVRTAMLAGLTDPGQIRYRQDVLEDCLRAPDVVREIYQIAVQAIADERTIYRASFFNRSSEALLGRSVKAMRMFAGNLRALRALTGEHADAFGSAGLAGFAKTVREELDEDYFAAMSDHLERLQFRNGLLASVRLGRHNQGVDYVLRVPRPENERGILLHRAPVKKPAYSRAISRSDDAGQQELAAMRDRILGLAADVLAQSAEHILDFFTALRAELAFYLGCLNVHEQLTATGAPICRPLAHPAGSAVRSARSLYDPCLALRMGARPLGNDLAADGALLIFITGANQGGKSTLLRAIGVGQLMMQAGMFVAAKSYTASTVEAVFTHYRREEDVTMVRGKFDEELQRMSDIGRRIRPNSLLLCNESFASTNEREAAEIATDVLHALNHTGIAVAFVTHLYELSHRFWEDGTEDTVFLRAERQDSGDRPFRLVEGEPLPTSFGQDLFRRTFGSEGAPDPVLAGSDPGGTGAHGIGPQP